jgi:hypothetical protein
MTGSTRPVVLVDRPAPRAAHSVQAAGIISDATARSAGRRAGRQFGQQTFANAVHRRGSAGLRSISVGKLEGTSATPHCANARTANIARMRGPGRLQQKLRLLSPMPDAALPAKLVVTKQRKQQIPTRSQRHAGRFVISLPSRPSAASATANQALAEQVTVGG